MAGMSIGVSHLVQSTRAGAGFGFQLVALVIAVHLAKYSFFEYGHRYASVTGESLLHGYQRLGRSALVVFFLIHAFTSVIGIAAIVFVTTALAQNLFQVGPDPTLWSAALIAASILLVIAGRFRGLDFVNKIMVVVLVVGTLLALAAAVWHGPVAPEGFLEPNPWKVAHLGFLIALMGWMPGAIEGSIFQSLWVVARDETNERRFSLADSLFDFNLGYGLTALMAVVFVSLGALVMYGSGEAFASSSVDFASQFVGLYGQTLGAWIRPVMAVVALMAMMTTSLTCIDASPRALAVSQRLLQGRSTQGGERLHAVWMIGVGFAALVIIYAFQSRFTQLIDLVTTISFLVAPVFAYLNMRLVASAHLPEDSRPGPFIRFLAVAGMVFLVGFGILYIVVRFGGFS